MWLKFPVPGPEQVNYGKRAHVIVDDEYLCCDSTSHILTDRYKLLLLQALPRIKTQLYSA